DQLYTTFVELHQLDDFDKLGLNINEDNIEGTTKNNECRQIVFFFTNFFGDFKNFLDLIFLLSCLMKRIHVYVSVFLKNLILTLLFIHVICIFFFLLDENVIQQFLVLLKKKTLILPFKCKYFKACFNNFFLLVQNNFNAFFFSSFKEFDQLNRKVANNKNKTHQL
ncbi:hypothetical protein RFI_24163, partial [Reticulomyxa filosa]